MKDDIANTKALIHGLAKTFSDAPDYRYKPENSKPAIRAETEAAY